MPILSAIAHRQQPPWNADAACVEQESGRLFTPLLLWIGFGSKKPRTTEGVNNSDMDRVAQGLLGSLVHRFAERRVRVDR